MQGGTLSRREGPGQHEFCEQGEVPKSATISIWATRKSLARVAVFSFRRLSDPFALSRSNDTLFRLRELTFTRRQSMTPRCCAQLNQIGVFPSGSLRRLINVTEVIQMTNETNGQKQGLQVENTR